ncbi:MAG: phosphoribosylanthranilate isomerase [Planctomycetes bacterium]|nr:phosphoribosylanthranilate isomerase [Planctomycetota bacterium]
MRPPVRIKVCCISSPDEARIAIDAGAHALGLVSAMPSGPGPISDELIAEIASRVPPGVDTFLLTCKHDAASIIDQLRQTRCRTVQLVDEVEEGAYARIRGELPNVRIVQVIHVQGRGAIEEARAAAEHVDAILLDSGRPQAAIKELGGTGRTHDWTISAALREAVSVPVYLAGGLNESNAPQAVRAVRPFGLDLCSGVRSNGKLDQAKLRSFVAAVRACV